MRAARSAAAARVEVEAEAECGGSCSANTARTALAAQKETKEVDIN